MTARKQDSIVLLIHCKDRPGIVARVSGFIHDFGGNILDSDHHTDEETNDFLMRMEFACEGFQIPPEDIPAAFKPIAQLYDIRYEVHPSTRRSRVGMMVSAVGTDIDVPAAFQGEFHGRRPALRFLVQQVFLILIQEAFG